MNFSAKLAMYSVATSLALAPSATMQASPVRLEYRSVAPDSERAKELWGDRLDGATMMSGEDGEGMSNPSVFVAEVERDGVKLTVTTIYASNMCNMENCPIRVFENGEIIEDTFGCYNITEHSMAESLRAMETCGQLILIDRK